MKVLYFDCFSGISGDMAIGALLDLGIDAELFKSELAKLELENYEIHINKKVVNGITGTDFSVVLASEEHEHHHEYHHEHNHENENHHKHHHEHHHEHHHDDKLAGHSHDSRNYDDICSLIDKSSLNSSIKAFSKEVFLEIAKAEAKVHGKDISEVHFHEVGAVDSIVDIVGAAICLDLLGIDRIYSSELHDGYGTIKCRHGVIPVPVPAVMEMLSGSGIPLISENIKTELVTPTGMALIKQMSCSFGRMPSMKVDKTGYGMGKRDTGGFNALRVVLGTMIEASDIGDEITILETNIDDSTPEVLGYVSEKLISEGALDVFYTPVYMKKNRPAFMLTVLANASNEDSLVNIILRQTSTIGIRKSVSKRYCMNREIATIKSEFGDVRIKIASWGDFKKASPEYEDCKRIAESTGIPLKLVYETVMNKIDANAL